MPAVAWPCGRTWAASSSACSWLRYWRTRRAAAGPSPSTGSERQRRNRLGRGGQSLPAGRDWRSVAAASGLAVALPPALDSQLEQAIDQLWVREATCLPELGEHADGRKARNSVDLVDHDLVRGPAHEEIDAREPGAFERQEDLDRHAPDALGHLGRERRRDQQLRPAIEVFGAVVVELVAGNDLARDRSFGLVVAQHRYLDLARVDKLLDENLLVVAERFHQRVRQL